MVKLTRLLVSCVALLATFAFAAAAQASSNVTISGSMEGSVKIANGDNVSAGYSFAVNGGHPAMQVVMKDAQITFSGTCSNGSAQNTLTVPLSEGPYSIAANDTSWHPANGQEDDPASFQGNVVASVCGGSGTLDASKGATFTGELQSDNTLNDVSVRFHYRDPNAKGKGNYDCSASTYAADVCGASWSGTAHIKPNQLQPPTPDIHTTKTVDKSVVHVGDTMTYTIVVSNPGGTNLNVTLDDFDAASNPHVQGCTFPAGTSFTFTLAPGGSKTFTCTKDAPAGVSSYTNEACATAPNPNGGPDLSSCATATTLIIHPAIQVVKTVGETVAHVGDVLHYTVVVSNTGDTGLTVSPSDTGCDGFDGSSFSLAAGASKTLDCTHTVTTADGSSYTNNACATGMDQIGGPNGTVSDCDQVTTPIIHPGISVKKTVAESGAAVGDVLHYTVVVTNIGDTPLTVTPSDTGCENFDGSMFQLGVGDSKTLQCTHTVVAGDGTAYTNEACATGMDQIGGPRGTVSACDHVTTPIAPPSTPPGTPPAQQTAPEQPAPQQVVLGERITPGSARLVGPTGCASKVFSAHVRGTKVATVRFVLDGKVIKRFTKTVKSGIYAVRINPASYKIGVHRLVATVTFQKGTGTKAKTMRLSFQRCAKKLVAPRFTG